MEHIKIPFIDHDATVRFKLPIMASIMLTVMDRDGDAMSQLIKLNC